MCAAGPVVKAGSCGDDALLTVNGQCKPKNKVVGCAGEVSSSEGCTLCRDVIFLKVRECFGCDATCRTCTETACLGCSSDDGFLVAKACIDTTTEQAACDQHREERGVPCWERGQTGWGVLALGGERNGLFAVLPWFTNPNPFGNRLVGGKQQRLTLPMTSRGK